jgi:hypothetical protein
MTLYGSHRFSIGDMFQVRDTLRVGTILSINSNNKPFYSYLVSFNDSTQTAILPEDIMLNINNPILLQNPLLQSSSGCLFQVGERINISDKTLMFRDPFRQEYVANKNGAITTIYEKSPNTIPPYSCMYEVRFDDTTIAVEVPETNIRKLNNFSNDLRNLNLLSNMNQMMNNNRNQSIFNTRNELDDLSINDKDLQKEVTKYFYKKTLKWLGDDHEFSSLKKQLDFIKSEKGLKYIKTLLKLFMKKHKAKWYELREDNYDDVKEFIRTHLKSI